MKQETHLRDAGRGAAGRQLSDTKREQILSAARRVLLEDGFNGASTQRINELLGVSKANVFNHFPAKAQLLEAVMLEQVRKLRDNAVWLQTETTAADMDCWAGMRDRFVFFKTHQYIHVNHTVQFSCFQWGFVNSTDCLWLPLYAPRGQNVDSPMKKAARWVFLAAFDISCGAGDGNRTHVICLGSKSPTIERHPHTADSRSWMILTEDPP